MATIKIKAKLHEGGISGAFYCLPIFHKSHCNMAEFRAHSRYGAFANSDIFPSVLARIRRDIAGDSGILYAGNLPENVSIERGFLDTITIDA